MGIKYSGTQAKKYAQFAEELFSWKYLEKPIIENYLKPIVNPHKRVLDTGCGTGRSTKLLFDLGFKEKNVIATDISPNMLEIAQKSLPGVEFVESDLASLDFKDRSFDIILSNMVLHYLDQRNSRKVINKFADWLDDGGYFLCIVVHPFRFPENYSQYFEDKAKVEKTPWNTKIEYYPKKISDYVNSVVGAGLELLRLEEPKPLSEGAQNNPSEFKKYSSIPSRLVIWAKKRQRV